jgi:hypothetical protein
MDDPSVTVTEPLPRATAVPEPLQRQLELVRRQLLGVALVLFAIFLLLAGAGFIVSGVLAILGLFVTVSGW